MSGLKTGLDLPDDVQLQARFCSMSLLHLRSHHRQIENFLRAINPMDLPSQGLLPEAKFLLSEGLTISMDDHIPERQDR